MLKKLSLIFFSFFIISNAFLEAQFYAPKKNNALFEDWRWNIFEELSDKGIRCLVEGDHHSVWFGTGKGVMHYDGLNWTQHLEENEILSKPIYGLYRAENGTIYAASVNGICHFTKGSWYTDIIFPPDNVLGDEWEILNFEQTDNGHIWIGLYFGVIEIYNKQISLYTTEQQLSDITIPDKNIKIEYVDETYPDLDHLIVYDILEDITGNLWLALEDGKTMQLEGPAVNLKSPKSYRIYDEIDGMNLSRLPVLYESKNGTLYQFSQSIGGGLNMFNSFNDNWTSIKLSEEFGGDDINYSMIETKDNILWLGGWRRVFAFKDNVWKEYKQPDLNIPQTRVILSSTTDGSLWMAGLLSEVTKIEYTTPLWNTYTGLNFQCEDAKGNFWFLSGSGNVIIYNNEFESWEALDTTMYEMSHPVRIFTDNSGIIWMLGSHEGVASLAFNNEGFWGSMLFPELCWSFHPNGVFQASDNSIWFGANADCGDALWGVVKYDPEKGTPDNYSAWEHFEGTNVCEVAYAMGEAEDGSILCGYYKGLFEYNGNRSRELHNILINDVMKIESIEKDRVKGTWIGTRSHGVIHYVNEKEWTQYTLENGLASNTVTNILIDKDSTVWITTDKGVSRYDGKKWIKYALPDYFSLGIGTGSIYQSSDGSIWFNKNALEWYRRVFYDIEFNDDNSPLVTYRIKPETDPPETYITQFEEVVYYPGNTVIFWNGKDRWNKTKTGELQYSYKLDDNDWSDFSSETNLSFLRLKSGKHKLMVRSRDNFLNIDTTPAAIVFKVKPPLWFQPWFIALMVVLIGTIVYLLLSTMQKNREVQARNAEMNKKNENLIQQQKEIEEQSKQIMELLESEKKNRWMNEGLLLIAEIIKTNKDKLSKLAKRLTIGLIDYLKIDYAALFIRNANNDEELSLIAGFNVNKEILAKKKFKKFEGLTGTCYAEKKTIQVDDITDSYYVESGLGKAKLKSLVLIPVKMHEDIVGVYEIASFKPIDDQVVDLIERASDTMASTILGFEASNKIEEMYNQSLQQSAQLKEQEEEMRQNMEELQATQEASQRREEELLKELEKFKKLEKELRDKIKKSGKK